MSVKALKTTFANSYATIYRDHSIVAVAMGTTLMLMATVVKVSNLIFKREPVYSEIFHDSNKSTKSTSAAKDIQFTNELKKTDKNQVTWQTDTSTKNNDRY